MLSPIGTNASGGVTRLLTHRVLGVQGRGIQLATTSAATATGTPVSLVTIGQSSVNASSYPTLVNTLSSPSRRTQPSSQATVLASPSRSNQTHPLSPSGSPQTRKRMRVSAPETPVSEEVLARRRLIAEHKLLRLKAARSKYADLAAELFFLQVRALFRVIIIIYFAQFLLTIYVLTGWGQYVRLSDMEEASPHTSIPTFSSV